MREYLTEHDPSRPAEVLAAATAASIPARTTDRAWRALGALLVDEGTEPYDSHEYWAVVAELAEAPVSTGESAWPPSSPVVLA